MSEMKKYTDIVRLGHRTTEGVLAEDDYVVVYEKLDGANASFTLNLDTLEMEAFSRNRKLDAENNLRGFYEYTKEIDQDRLNRDYIYFGEWLVKHKIDYGVNKNEFYLFDIYDKHEGEYLSHVDVVAEAFRLNLTLAPILYAGKYRGFDHLQTLVGRSALANEATGGEGVVVKNVSYRDKFGKQLFVKVVSNSFREMHPQKAPRDPAKLNAEQTFVRTFATKGRIDKLLRKMIDEGVIEEKFDLSDMGVILSHLGGRVYDDLMKEEFDSLPKDFEEKAVRKAIGKYVPVLVREIIEEETKQEAV
ncbi:RNA ligase family protein [Bacillus licheniformis]|uniref:RNA ligase family protein n=1 Tax=Bacillus licheniformis TaxID=1402 RepID=UPI00228154A7|nr:RNA ligase family protein [Bacillus licheniformis]MCY9220575.1 RNA ligase family protein [Bacillus licheniformis]